MRRSLCALAVVASLLPLATLASAQDAQVADGGAPLATSGATTTTAPTTTAPVVTATVQAPPPPVVTVTTVPTMSEQEPLRLGRLIELEADRAGQRRIGASAVEMAVGAGGVLSGALVFTIDTSGVDSSLVTVLDILGVTSIVVGGLAIADGLISLFVESPMERLFKRYAPIAIDKTMTAAERVHRGEQLLEGMANVERTQRITGGASSIVIAIVEAGLAIFIGADNDLWANDGNAGADRAIFTTAFAIGAATSLGEGIGKILWERGPAEIAWEHWHAQHEMVTVQTAKVKITPTVAPLRGGAAVGLTVRF